MRSASGARAAAATADWISLLHSSCVRQPCTAQSMATAAGEASANELPGALEEVPPSRGKFAAACKAAAAAAQSRSVLIRQMLGRRLLCSRCSGEEIATCRNLYDHLRTQEQQTLWR